MADKNFPIINNEYVNTGGGCMVNITTVYDLPHSRTLYVLTTEDYLTITTYDHIRNELPDVYDAADFVLYSMPVDYLTWEPSFDNRWMTELPEEYTDVVWDCWQKYLISATKDEKSNQSIDIHQVPPSIKIVESFWQWLKDDENSSSTVETNGECVYYPDEYYEWFKTADGNGKVADDMRNHLMHWLESRYDDNDSQEKFESARIQIIFDDTVHTFDNGADVFNALVRFCDDVIEEQ